MTNKRAIIGLDLFEKKNEASRKARSTKNHKKQKSVENASSEPMIEEFKDRVDLENVSSEDAIEIT